MSLRIVGPDFTEISAETPPSDNQSFQNPGDDCNPRSSDNREFLIGNYIDFFYDSGCPIVNISPPPRVCDNRNVWTPTNGLAAEAQNLRQMSGFSDYVDDTVGRDREYHTFCFNGRAWSDQFIVTRGIQIINPAGSVDFTTVDLNEASADLNEGYSGDASSQNMTKPCAYFKGTNLGNPSLFSLIDTAGQASYWYAGARALGADENSTLSNYALSTADLLTIFDYRRYTNEFVDVRYSPQQLTSSSGASFPSNEPTSGSFSAEFSFAPPGTESDPYIITCKNAGVRLRKEF